MGEKAAKVENFGAYLSEVTRSSHDRVLLQLAAQVVGHLVRSNVQLTAALVDGEVLFLQSFQQRECNFYHEQYCAQPGECK